MVAVLAALADDGAMAKPEQVKDAIEHYDLAGSIDRVDPAR